MKIKILIPVYNDWQSVFKLLNDINLNLSNLDHEISVIIINDASNHDRQDEEKTLENIQSIKILNMKLIHQFVAALLFIYHAYEFC